MKAIFILAISAVICGTSGYVVGVHAERARHSAQMRERAAWCKTYALRFGWPKTDVFCTPHDVMGTVKGDVQ